ncbi:MAG: hypothetical protein ACOX4D_07720 [Bacteroidales bacterium]
MQNSTSVLRLKFSAKNPAHRQYAARYHWDFYALLGF